MPASLETFTESLQRLIQKFQADRNHYLSKQYSEAQARVDFITPFFKALGWDVENEAGLAHHQREVMVESGGDSRLRGNDGRGDARPPRLQLPHLRRDPFFRRSQSPGRNSYRRAARRF